MGDALALNPEKLAFIHGEKAVGGVGRRTERIQPTDQFVPKQPAGEEAGPSRARIRRRGRRTKVAPPEPLPAPEMLDRTYSGELPPLLVSLTTRLSPATADALRRAALELRLQRRRPHTQQEIIEAAVCHWLATNGFLRPA
jgi:hypothetical protein